MAALLFLLALIPGGMVSLMMGLKKSNQTKRDAQRKVYTLSFPQSLEAESVISFVRSIAGTLRRLPWSFSSVPTIALELWATNRGMTYRLRVPWQYEEYVIPQLRSRGVRVEPEVEFPSPDWTAVVELGVTHSSRPLRIVDPAETSLNLLSSVQTLQDDETVVMQWVVTPAVPKALPVHDEAVSYHPKAGMLTKGNKASRDEVNDRRTKLMEPNLLAVLRIAAVAETPIRADHLLHRVRDALASARGPHTHFYKRLVPTGRLRKRIELSSGLLFFPIQLSATELASLIAFPIGNPHVAGLPPYMSKHLPASEMIPREGRQLGRSNFPGQERTIAMDYQNALTHVLVTSPTGNGKSTLLANLAKQDMENGYGVIIIESKGGTQSLFNRVIHFVPPERIQDVVVVDLKDENWPVGFNILQQGDPLVVADELFNLFYYLYRDMQSIWAQEALHHGLRTLILDPKATFVDLIALFRPRPEEVEWADNLRRRARDPEMRQFWEDYENQKDVSKENFIRPLRDRIWQLTSRARLRNIIGQSESGFQIADVIKHNKILFVNLDGIEAQTASLAGTLMFNAIWHAAKMNHPSRPNFLYLDEFQDTLKLPIGIADMLNKARGFGLGMVLAHQDFSQLTPDVRSAVMNNAKTKLFFQSGPEDARLMARGFAPLEEHDFQSFAQFEGATRVATAGGISAPVTFKANPPAKSYDTADLALTFSRQRYGRPVADVQRAIEERRQTPHPDSPTRPRPRISGTRGDNHGRHHR